MSKYPLVLMKTQKLISTASKFTCRSPLHQGFLNESMQEEAIFLIHSDPPRYHRSPDLRAEFNSKFFQNMLSMSSLRENNYHYLSSASHKRLWLNLSFLKAFDALSKSGMGFYEGKHCFNLQGLP